jgi:hypothetical protein
MAYFIISQFNRFYLAIFLEYEDDPDIGNELEMLSPDSGVDGVYFDRCEGKWLVANINIPVPFFMLESCFIT